MSELRLAPRDIGAVAWLAGTGEKVYKRKPHVSRTRESVRWTFAGILFMYHHRRSRSKPSRWVPNAMTCAVDGLIIHENSQRPRFAFLVDSLTHSLIDFASGPWKNSALRSLTRHVGNSPSVPINAFRVPAEVSVTPRHRCQLQSNSTGSIFGCRLTRLTAFTLA